MVRAPPRSSRWRVARRECRRRRAGRSWSLLRRRGPDRSPPGRRRQPQFRAAGATRGARCATVGVAAQQPMVRCAMVLTFRPVRAAWHARDERRYIRMNRLEEQNRPEGERDSGSSPMSSSDSLSGQDHGGMTSWSAENDLAGSFTRGVRLLADTHERVPSAGGGAPVPLQHSAPGDRQV